MQYAKRVVRVTQCLFPMCYLVDNCLDELVVRGQEGFGLPNGNAAATEGMRCSTVRTKAIKHSICFHRPPR